MAKNIVYVNLNNIVSNGQKYCVCEFAWHFSNGH
jgi:hypothetical protein